MIPDLKAEIRVYRQIEEITTLLELKTSAPWWLEGSTTH
mgnify:CR=1 FL=1